MKRRIMLKGLLASVGVGAASFRLPLVHAADHTGKLIVFVQADGGWDPTSFCDPKANTPGEPVINHWAERDEIREAGGIRYAPFAKNEEFFKKYHERMLVINGVDAQTNSHTVGVVHNWSGRNSEGYPALTALLAAEYGADLPVSYLSFGGYSDTGGLTRYTRLSNPDLIRNIARPAAVAHNDNTRYMDEASWAAVRERRTVDIGAFDNGARLATTRCNQPSSLPVGVCFLRRLEGVRGRNSGRGRARGADKVQYSKRKYVLEQPASSGTVDRAGIQDGCYGQR